MKNRTSFYQLLSRLFEKEISEDLLSQLSKMEYPTDVDQPEMQEGYRLLSDFFKNTDSEGLLDELAADYAKVFLAAG